MGLFDQNIDAEDGVTLDPNPALAPLTPLDLGLSPAPEPMQGPQLPPVGMPTPPQAPQGQSQTQRILSMALAGLAAGLGPRRGGGIPQGVILGQRQNDQAQQQRFQNEQVVYRDQRQAAIQQQQMQAQEEAVRQKRQADLERAVMSIRADVKTIPDKSTYDQRIEGYAAAMQKFGYRLDANALRTMVPYVAPSGKQRAQEALKSFFDNPLTKEQLKNDPESVRNGSIKIDLNGDGVAELVPLQRVMEAAGQGVLVDDQGQPVGMAPSDQGDKFQVALRAKIAEFRATNRRGPDPKEKLKLVEEATNIGKDTESNDRLKSLQTQGAELSNQIKQQQLSAQPTPEQIAMYAKLLSEHKMSPSQLQIMGGGMGQQGRNFLRQVQTEVMKIDPNFNFEEGEAEYQLVKSPSFQNTVRYMDSVVESLPRLQQTANKLANGRIRGINALINAGKNQYNDVDLKKFKTDVLFVADEIAKILQGGGTGSGTSDAKLRQAGEIISTNDSPQAIAAALGEAAFLMGNRRSSLTRGTYLDRPVVDPAASAREKLMKR